MKKVRKILAAMLSIMLLVSIVSVSNVSAGEYTQYNKLEIEDMQLNKARIKTASSDSNGKHVEVYWQQDPLDTYDKLTDITFARSVFKAPKAGDYRFQIRVKNDSGSSSIKLMFFVNDVENEIEVAGSNTQTVSKTVSLKEGENSIVLAWVNWGYFDYINYPADLEIVNQSSGNTYYAFESALNEVQLAPTNGFHSPKASLYTAPIEYNSGDEEWQGSATFTVDAASTIKSMDLHYYALEYNNGKAQLGMTINGGNEVKIDLSGSKTAEELVKSISEKTLLEAGFKPGEKNTIKFRQSSATGGKIGLYSIVLKEEVVEETTTVPTKEERYEAEDAYIISSGKIKTSESDSEGWSKGSYVGEFAPTKITKPSQIDEYCSNVGHLQYKVNVDKAGYYKVTLAYATESDMSVYMTSGYEWSKVALTSTGSWDAIGEKSEYVYLKKGLNYIWVTGPTTEEGWVNYDYIDIEYAQEGTIDTSKTVLFMDKKVKAEQPQEEEVNPDPDIEPAEETPIEETKSPQTGVESTIILLIVIMIVVVGIYIFMRTRKRI